MSRITLEPQRPECEANLRPRYPIESAAWIWHPACEAGATAVLQFVNRFRVDAAEETVLHVSADERYALFLDGVLISRGPDRCDVAHWSFSSYRLCLDPGEHVLEATVWSIGEAAPKVQLSHRGGFILAAEGALGAQFDTGRGDWQVADRTAAWTFENRPDELAAFLVGAHQTIHGDRWFAPGAWVAPGVVLGPLVRAEWYTVRAGWKLRPSPLPDQVCREQRPGRIVAVIPGGLDAETPLPAASLAYPAPGTLRRLATRMPHPRGVIEVDLEFPSAGVCRGHVVLPAETSGELVWGGCRMPLRPGIQTVACGA